MSDHANNVKAFISLLDNQPSLFAQHQDDLNQLSYSCGDDIETVSDALALWCNSHPKIEEELITAYSQLPETKFQPLLEQVRPFGGKVEPLQPSDQNEMLVTTLKNKMRKVPQSSETNSDSSQTNNSESQSNSSPKN
ncbi:MAG: hypothetical protein KME08_00830 [Aphanothece sp. CMT-3BRIN-NPC111]|jgi:hypothetical protein|nr:hypothetical protein [Aphanothece sp. CMT-3BRIN-NPC111]